MGPWRSCKSLIRRCTEDALAKNGVERWAPNCAVEELLNDIASKQVEENAFYVVDLTVIRKLKVSRMNGGVDTSLRC